MNNEEREFFDSQSGHLTDEALRALVVQEELGELTRLEISEHLSFCDHCLDRYMAAMETEPLMETPELLKPSIMRELRRKVIRVTTHRYFTVGVSACLALVLWVTGVFGMPTTVGSGEREAPKISQPRPGFSQTAGSLFDSWSGGIADFFDNIDLRGVFESNEEAEE